MKKLTNALVILRLKENYGESLDYSLVNYVNSRTPIKLICPKHGEFEQYANNAMQGRGGCLKCKKTLADIEDFIEKSREIHGDKYDYSLSNFINGSNKLKIICPTHGEFYLTARHHAIDGCGCPKCGVESRKLNKPYTADIFIEKSKIIHKDKYDYSKVNYINTETKVCIICPEHGEFWQRPHNHLQGQGCPKCGVEKVNKTRLITTEEFIERVSVIHNNKYNYNKVNYINTDTKVIITCPKHGDFELTPHIHLKGCGCPKCGYENISQKNSLSLEEYITTVKLVHNSLYDYSKVFYNGIYNKIEIICPIHGSFFQTAHDHIKGAGCPKCNKSKGELFILNYLTENKIDFISQYEITIDKEINPSGYAYIDFYLPKYNAFIEYNGELHYIPIKHFGGDIKFEKQQKRDKYIRDYCKRNNINLLEIKYDISFDNIINSINEFINNEI